MDVQVTRVTDHPPPPPREPRTRLRVAGVLHGLGVPMGGLRYLLKHPSLWPLAVLPMLINLAVTLLVLSGLGVAAYHFLVWMHTWPTFSSGWSGRLWEIGAALLVIAIALSLAAALYLLLGGILTAYFNEKLAREVELQLGTPASVMCDVPFKYQLTDGIINFITIFFTAAGCLMLNCIPLIGTVLGGAINLYVACFVFGYDYLDIPMALRGMRRHEKRVFAKRHRPQVLGLGAMVFLMNFIPVVGSIFLTTAAVGAVLLHRQLCELDGLPIPVARV